MLDNIIGNEKAKFMTSYFKLEKELNKFSSPDRGDLDKTIKRKNILSNHGKLNFLLNENNKNERKEFKNIFKEDQKKFKKWEDIKNSIKKVKTVQTNTLNNFLNYNSNNNNFISKNNNEDVLFDKIRSNIIKLKRQFDLEKEKNLFDNKAISPKNKIMFSTRNRRKNIFSFDLNSGNLNNLNYNINANNNLEANMNEYLNSNNNNLERGK
jgi:hypothetical protein